MKRLTVILVMLALVLIGATAVLAQDVPQALQGVNLSSAQVVTPAQAQQIRGANPGGIPAWVGMPGYNGMNSNSHYYEACEHAYANANGQAIFHSRVFRNCDGIGNF